MSGLRPPPTRSVVVLLAICTLALSAAGPAVNATARSAPGCASGTDNVDLHERVDTEYGYLDGLTNDSRADWTGGDVLRIGARGDCSLAVTNGSASLTAATVDADRGVLRATVDVGRGGAIRLSREADAPNPTANGTDPATNATASLAVRNRGRENGVGVEVVTRDATGTVDTVRTTAPSGRFFRLEVRLRANGTARVALWPTDDAEPDPDDWHTVRTRANATGNASGTWRVGLDARAYLDEIGIGTRERAADTDPDDAGPGDGSDGDDDPFPTMPPGDQSADGGDDPATGLVLGPFVVLLGAGIFKFAYGLTRFNEQLDAIGSTTKSSEVEPAGWNVALTRFVGAVIAGGGLLWILTSLATILG